MRQRWLSVVSAVLLVAAMVHHQPSSALTVVAPRVVLARGKARLFREGERLVFGGAVKSAEAAAGLVPGELVDVVDGEQNLIGWGPFNPDSMFRVRLLWHVSDPPVPVRGREGPNGPESGRGAQLAALLHARFALALQKRQRCGLPNQDTNTFRLINSEGDGLSGLVVDVFGSVAVVSSSAVWCEHWKQMIMQAAAAALGGGVHVEWHQSESRLLQDGWQRTQADPEPEADLWEVTAEAAVNEVVITELGVKYLVSPGNAQKTGFYCDQRDNRLTLRSFVRPADTVLDVCCYSGAFAMHAAMAGAGAVTAVDSSAPALALARRNAELNNIPAGRITFEREDMSKFMDAAIQQGRSFDIVVLDPPKLAPSRRALDRAMTKYRRLNRKAATLVKPGGLLVTCTCSSAMTRSGKFLETVHAGARDAGRSVSLLKQAGAAPDHTLNPACSEGDYLTALFLYVD